MGDFVGTAVIAELWDCKQSTITKWCREGKIVGAEQDRVNSPWRIPADAKCPTERKRKEKEGINDGRKNPCKK